MQNVSQKLLKYNILCTVGIILSNVKMLNSSEISDCRMIIEKFDNIRKDDGSRRDFR